MEQYNYGGLQYSIVSKNKKKNKKKGVQLTPGVIHHSLSFLRLVTKTRLVLPWCEYHVGRLYRHVQSKYTLSPCTCYSSIFKKATHKKVRGFQFCPINRRGGIKAASSWQCAPQDIKRYSVPHHQSYQQVALIPAGN